MSDISSQNETPNSSRCEAFAYTYAYWILRAWLAMRAIFTGLEKYAGKKTVQIPLLDEFGNPDINGTLVAVDRKVYGFSYYEGLPHAMRTKFAAEPLLPSWLMDPYAAMLGPALIILGLTLLLGLASRTTLFIMGMVYVSLTYGLVLINESGGIAWLGVHVIMIVGALCLVRHDRFCVTKRW